MRRESVLHAPEPDRVPPAPLRSGIDALPLQAGPPAHSVELTRPIFGLLAARSAVSVLELGCGNGWFSAMLGRCGFDVVGTELNEDRVQEARRRHPELSFLRHDLREGAQGLPRGLDAVVAIDVVDRLAQPRRLIEAAQAALAPGGLLIVTAPHHGYLKNLALALGNGFDRRWQALQPEGPLKFFSAPTLRALLGEAGFEQVELRRVGRVPVLARSMIVSGRLPG